MSAMSLWGKLDPITLNHLEQLRDVTANIATSRREFFNKFFDERRDIDAECGYPSNVQGYTAEDYRNLVEREPLANRVVAFMPKEAWQRQPTVFESKDPTDVTPFEADWDNFAASVATPTGSWYQDEKGGGVWSVCQDANIAARIGSFGIMLIGFDDGQPLDMPVKLREPTKRVEPIVDEQTGKAVGIKQTITDRKAPMPDSPMDEATKDKVRGLKVNSQHEKDAVDRMLAEKRAVTDPAEEDTELDTEPKSEAKLGVRYLRSFPEYQVQIVQYEADPKNPRCGMPVMYRVTLSDPRRHKGGIGQQLSTVMVHWTRVIHIADTFSNYSSSRVFAPPACEPVLNPLLDIKKVRGAGSEAYWKNCLISLSMETHPSLGGDVDVDVDAIRDMLENRNNSLDRDIITKGMTAKPLTASFSDPTPLINVLTEAIAIQLGAPVRVLKGSERGEQASTQDDSNWDDRVMGYCLGFCTPAIIVQLTDRLIAASVLTEPEGYSIKWPDFESLSKKDKVAIAQAKVGVVTAAIQGGVDQVMPIEAVFTEWLDEDEETVQEWVDQAELEQQQHMEEQQALADEQGMAIDGEGNVVPHKVQVDQFGNEVKQPGTEDAGKKPFGKSGQSPPDEQDLEGEDAVQNAWTDEAREAARAALLAKYKSDRAEKVEKSPESHAHAGDAHTWAGVQKIAAAKQAMQVARFKAGDKLRAEAEQHLLKAKEHYGKSGRGPEEPSSWKYAQNIYNVFCATGEGGGIDPTCSPGESGGGGSGGGGSGGGSDSGGGAALHEATTALKAEPTSPPPPHAPVYDPVVHHDSDKDGVTDAARIGVPGKSVPPPPGIGRIPNLTPHERQVESEFADAFEKEPNKMANDYRKLVTETTKPGDPPTFATDDAKVLHAAWSHPDQETRSQNRATLNTPLHQTANAIAKRAFVDHLDTLKEGDSILVTVGGCGAGKGYALKNVPEALAMKAGSKAVWDSAGDQNATENPWIQREAEKRGLKVNYVFVHADPYSQWADPGKGVVSRAANPADGRMVDAKVFADSYAIGARNHQAFYDKHKDNENAKFVFLDNTGKPKLMDKIPESALKLDSGHLAKYAQDVVAKSTTAPAHVKRGALMGERIWSNE